MKVGDIVMFVSDCRYAKWFFGQLGIVEKYTEKTPDGNSYCGVRWFQPVKYHDRYTAMSSFPAEKFEVYNESR